MKGMIVMRRRRKQLRRVVSLAVVGLGLMMVEAQAYTAIVNKTDNTEIHIVPAPGQVAIDGDLKDWDLSGAILMFLDEGSKAVYSVRAAMMYDAEFFYVGARVKDPTPMINNYAFGGQVDMSWNADAIQMRFISNPEIKSRASLQSGGRMSKEDQQYVNHITFWYSTQDQKAGFFICYTLGFKDPQVNPEGVEGKYREDKSGKGYRFEYRIPWKVLRAPRPFKGGDKVQTQFQLHWGDKLGRGLKCGMTDVRNAKSRDLGYMGPESWGLGIVHSEGNLKRKRKERARRPDGHIGTPYMLKRDSKVSLAIYDAKGKLVRTRLGAVSCRAGLDDCMWDGLSDYDKPMPPGKYTARFLFHEGIKPKYVCDVGITGNPPYRNEDGTGGWAGDDGYPWYVSTDDGERIILGTGAGEAADITICADTEGQKKWGINMGGYTRGPLEAHDGHAYFFKIPAGQLGKFELERGYLKPFSGGKPSVQVLQKGKDEPKQEWVKRVWNIRSVAVVGDTIVISSRGEDKLILLDLASGERKGELALEKPSGLAGARGALYAVSRDAIGRVDLKSGEFTMIREKLDGPQHLAVGPDGAIYVSLQGETQQVWRLSPEGKIQQKYGKKGGRPALGKFDPAGMLNPYDLGVDKNGRLWVAEADNQPKRYTVWNPDGKLYREFFGSMNYSTGAYVDPTEPDHIYAQSVRYRIDYEKGSWAPDACFVRPSKQSVVVEGLPATPKKGAEADETPSLTIEFPRPTIHPGPGPIAVRGGRKFLWIGNSKSGGCMYEIVKGMAVPRMRLVKARGRGAVSYWWLDEDNDGKVAGAEVRLEEPLPPDCNFFWAGVPMGADLSIYTYRGVPWHGQGGAKTTKPYSIVKWTCKGVNAQGGLVYGPPGEAEVVATDPDGGAVSDLHVDAEGDIYVLVSGGTLQRGQREQGSGHRVVKFSADGKKQWEYHKVHCAFAWTSNSYGPGDIVGVCCFSSGSTEDFVALTGYYGHYFLLDKKAGLFVDAIGEDQRSPYTMGHHMVHTENFNGTLYRRSTDGKTYFSGGDADMRIWELTGLNTLKRHSREFQVTKAMFAQSKRNAQQAATAQAHKLGKKACYVRRLRGGRADGQYHEWGAAHVLTIHMDDKRAASAQLGYDDKNLYLRFQVTDESPLKNTPTDYKLLFKTGDAIELQISSNMNTRNVRSQNRQDPKIGDTRVIMTRKPDGQMVATVLRPRIAEREKPHRHTYESVVWKEPFDEVREVNDLPMHAKTGANSYVVEAAVPWTLLGIEPKPGLKLAGDVGVIYGDKGGTRNAIRYMWNDKSPEVSINNDIPSEVRMHPNDWGQLVLE